MDVVTAPDVLQLAPTDNVVLALNERRTGESLGSAGVTAQQTIPAGHKAAIAPIGLGEPIRKYGQIIGFASTPIAPGEHVHLHNVAMRTFERETAAGIDARPTDFIVPSATFRGIVRPDGRVATRNYLGVVTTVNCSATAARHIADRMQRELDGHPTIDGVVAITHTAGCGMAAEGEAMDVLRRTIGGYAQHANFAGVLILGLGCEDNQADRLVSAMGLELGPMLQVLTIQDAGGTTATIKRGMELLREMVPQAAKATRTTVPASELTLALQCGGSDGYSGITANPALGTCVDLLVRNGGTAILSETPEIYGAEHLLTRRAQSSAVAQKLLDRIHWWEAYTERNGGAMNNNPSPGNKAGGLTTILEKSLGAVAKGGSTNLVAVNEYAEPVKAHGLIFMDTPGYDPVSATGQVAGGANMICFTTGRGSVFGAKPVPSLKLATNSALYARMTDDMDVNCGTIADGRSTIAEKGREIFDLMLRVASGEPSRSEALGFGDNEFAPWVLGAVM